MIYLKNALILLALFVGSAVFSQQWVTVKDTNFGYRADFPGQTEKKVNPIPTEKGEVTMHSHSFTGRESDKNLIYMSSFTEYPKSFFPEGLDTELSQNNVLDGAVNGAVTNVNGTLLSNENIRFNGYPGRLFKIEIERGEKFIITMKAVLVGFKFYMIQTIAREQDSDNEDTTRFFNSFELIKIRE